MIKRKKSGGGSGANWMDTYGDMVTLLLCFFVLLYSISTVDQQKWEALVRSFNPDATPTQTETTGNDGPSADPTSGTTQESVDNSIEQLYNELQNYIAQQDEQNSISAVLGDGYVFLSLDDTVFFNPDRYALLPAGKRVLDDLGAILAKVAPAIDELRIMGHTAQADINQPNDSSADRFLASNRATVALVYLQDMGFMDPARMVSVGYGQWRPIASNATAEDKQKNRRVEIIITGKNLENAMSDSITQYDAMRNGNAAS